MVSVRTPSEMQVIKKKRVCAINKKFIEFDNGRKNISNAEFLSASR